MSGFHLLTPSWTSGATCGANSNANNSVTGANLLFVQPSRKWRSAILGTLRLTLDAQSEKSWDTIALLQHNGTASGTLQVFATNTGANLFTAPDYTSALLPLRFPGDLGVFDTRGYDFWAYLGAIRSHRYIGLQIIDGTNPDGYFEAGVVMVGVKFTPGVGPDLGARTGRDDPSSVIRLLNGEGIVRPKRGIDTGTWTFPMQTPAETIRWREINRTYGQKIPVVAKWDPIPTQLDGSYQQHTFYYGYPQWRSGGPITYTNGHGLNDVEMGLVEV
jgi:hypothetical protein